MADDDLLNRVVADLFREVTMGTAADAAWVLNPGDRGLLASLEALSAGDASARPGGRASIAAHTDHVRYGLHLLNRWASGEADPFSTADYSASWRRQTVTEREWKDLRDMLARESRDWQAALRLPRHLDVMALSGMISSVVHLAYHLGAIRQLNAAAAGPPNPEPGTGTP
jgi:hypothetical protein